MSYTTVRERSRYRAEIPQASWPHGREPRWRPTRKRALEDLAAALAVYLDKQRRADPVIDVVAWSAWALRIGSSQLGSSTAPDGSVWLIRRRVEYL